MSDKSDEELIGDVDNFDINDSEEEAEKERISDPNAVSEKEHRKNPDRKYHDDKTKIQVENSPTLNNTKKSGVKKTVEKRKPVADDLLQAFAAGVPSVRKTGQISSAKKRKEPDSSKKVTGSLPTQQREHVEDISVIKKARLDLVKGKSEKTAKEVDKPSSCQAKKETQSEHIPTHAEKLDKVEKRAKSKEDTVKEIVSENKSEPVKAQLEIKSGLRQQKPDLTRIKKEHDTEKDNVCTVENHFEKIKEEIKIDQIKTEMALYEVEKVKDITKKVQDKIVKVQDKVLAAAKFKKREVQKVKDEITSSPVNKKSEIQTVNLKTVSDVKHKSDVRQPHHIKNSNSEKQLKGKSDGKPAKSAIQNTHDKTSSSQSKRKVDDDRLDSPHPAKLMKSEPLKPDIPDPVKDKVKDDNYILTEEDYKSMDNFLADEMLNTTTQKSQSRSAVKYIVQVSPLEILDLGEPSVQQIIQFHPTTTLIFKRQAVKLKKKKGFAETTFSTMTGLKEFVYQLTQLKVSEKILDVVITTKQAADILSFKIHLNRNGKLLKLISSGEDPKINNPIPAGVNTHKIQFEKVPSTTSSAFMHGLFPFTNNVLVTKTRVGTETNPLYHGPLCVYFVNAEWMEAVEECCKDFTVNGLSLLPVNGNECVTKETSCERKQSAGKDRKKSPEKSDNNEEEDLVSSMTRDVCADMLQSLKKLKELESDNPNMKRILEMQEQLDNLQKSLVKPKAASDEPSNDKERHGESSKGQGTIASSSTPIVKKQKEMQILEKQLEEADRAERLKEEERQKKREMDLQKSREESTKKSSLWARKAILDYKQDGVKGDKISEEAEKFLKEREQRIKEKENEIKRKEELEKKKAEELLLKQQEEERIRCEEQKKKEREEQKESERKRLIQKIEEARLSDSKKAEKLAASQLMWNPSHPNSGEESSPNKNSKKRSQDSKHWSKREHGKAPEDNVDERLAGFQKELAKEGKIDRRSSLASRRRDESQSSFHREEDKNGCIVTEDEYHIQYFNSLPDNYQIRLTYMVNRYCPVKDCPAKTYFKTKDTFLEHWSIFHRAETTMRFCQRCSAYFMNLEELVNHIEKYHRISNQRARNMAQTSRVKIIPNPSFRDPYPFLSPL